MIQIGEEKMKNVVVFGGGTGLSHILKGLKLFPVNVTAIISVSDNGSSTGILKKELNFLGKKKILLKDNLQKCLISLIRQSLNGKQESQCLIILLLILCVRHWM